MKKKYPPYLVLFALSAILFSCRKDTPVNNSSSSINTTTLNIKTDSTGVTLSQAKQLALNFLQSKNASATITIKSAETIVKDGVPYFHIINANNNNGFVILSPDSGYAPLLAYDSIGNFDKNNLNPGLIMWLNKHACELNFIRTAKTPYRDSIVAANKNLWAALWSTQTQTNPTQARPETAPINIATSITNERNEPAVFTQVGPLCATYWDQMDGFNDYCPLQTGSTSLHDPTGCDPTAMAQIMHFWSVPTKYNWSIMPLTPYTGLASGLLQVAQLMSDIGTTLGIPQQFTSYGNSASSSKPEKIPQVFESFGYSSSITGDGYSNSGTGFAGSLYNELSINKRPCILSGWPSEENNFLGLIYSATGEGHTWVCDGYQSTVITGLYTTYGYNPQGALVYQSSYSQTISQVVFLHMNWGFGAAMSQLGGSNNDGWYNDGIDYTTAPNVGTGAIDYQYFQIIITNIHP